MVTVLYNVCDGSPYYAGSSFNDVSSSAYYRDAVYWGKAKGIVNGINSTKFAPNTNVTREQIVTFLYRFAQTYGYSTAVSGSLNGFSDRGQVSSYAQTPMKWAIGKGIITGRTSTTLVPQGAATRAEVSTFVHRFITKLM